VLAGRRGRSASRRIAPTLSRFWRGERRQFPGLHLPDRARQYRRDEARPSFDILRAPVTQPEVLMPAIWDWLRLESLANGGDQARRRFGADGSGETGLEHIEVRLRRFRNPADDFVAIVTRPLELRVGQKKVQSLVATRACLYIRRLRYSEVDVELSAGVRVPAVLIALEPDALITVADETLEREAGSPLLFEIAFCEQRPQSPFENLIELLCLQWRSTLIAPRARAETFSLCAASTRTAR